MNRASTVVTVKSINYNVGALKELSPVEAEDVNIKTGAQSIIALLSLFNL